jgi:hypothetical protein
MGCITKLPLVDWKANNKECENMYYFTMLRNKKNNYSLLRNREGNKNWVKRI